MKETFTELFTLWWDSEQAKHTHMMAHVNGKGPYPKALIVATDRAKAKLNAFMERLK